MTPITAPHFLALNVAALVCALSALSAPGDGTRNPHAVQASSPDRRNPGIGRFGPHTRPVPPPPRRTPVNSGPRPSGRHAPGSSPVELISRAFDGGPALGPADSFEPSISADGRYVAFSSDAINFGATVPGMRNVFVWDRLNGILELVRLGESGGSPSISSDGRYVAFEAGAGDTVPRGSVFVRDRLGGTTTLVSVATDGSQRRGDSPSISADGRYVAFSSFESQLVAGDTNGHDDVFVRDRLVGMTTLVSVASDGSQANSYSAIFGAPSISADGRYVAFTSDASNLVPGDTNNAIDVFVRDRVAGTTRRVSVANDGSQPDGDSTFPSISADGRYVAFESRQVIFVRDQVAGTTELVDLASDGQPGNGYRPSISADGRYVAFASFRNLVDRWDVFLRDRVAGTTTLVSGASNEFSFVPSISADGRYVAFASSANTALPEEGYDVFVRDLAGGSTRHASVRSDGVEGVKGGDSGGGSVSPDGRYVAFWSFASNLVPGDTNGLSDVFVRDRATGTTTLISVGDGGLQGNGSSFDPSISADGRYVAFASDSDNLTPDDTDGTYDVFVRDRVAGTTTLVASDASRESVSPSISGEGRYVAFVSGDRNGNFLDVFVRDRVLGTTTLVSEAADGSNGNSLSYSPSMSADGRYVAFVSRASNLVPEDTNTAEDVFVRSVAAGTTTRASVASDGSQANLYGYSYSPSISADGRYVAFASSASNLVPEDTNAVTDVFVRDRVAGATTRVSVATDGSQGNSYSHWPSLSADGRYVAFASNASNLAVPGATHSHGLNVFVADRLAGTTTQVSVANDGSPGNGSELGFSAPYTSISADGRYVAFRSDASNLVSGHTNGAHDVFLVDQLDLVSNSVAGRVTENGVGLVGVQVQAGSVTATSAADGSYTLTGLSPGTYTVTPSKAEYDFSPETHSVTVGPDQSSIDFTGTQRSYSIGGRVLYRDTGLAGATIAAGVRTTTSGPDGVYLLQGLTAGTEQVTVTLSDLRFEPVSVTVGPSQTAVDFEAALPSAGRLRVTGAVVFGVVRVGVTRTRTLTLTNGSRTQALWVSVDAPTAPFSIVSGGGLVRLDPGRKRLVTLACTPMARGKVFARLSVRTSDPARALASVRLTANGR